jgi:N-methylhydantoinase B
MTRDEARAAVASERWHDPIELQMAWERLIFVADQADIALGQSAFSPIVRESHDYVTVLLDSEGSGLAQASHAIPSFIGTLPVTARAILSKFGADNLGEGDVIITNDPHIATGHLPDISMFTPIFRGGRLVAIAANVAHMPDIGGRPLSADAMDLVEEGIRIPPMKIYRAGAANDDLIEILRASVRMSDQVLGDLQGQIAANEIMRRELLKFMDELSLDSLAGLGGALYSRADASMRAGIAELKPGVYEAQMLLDGFDEDIRLCAAVRVGDGLIHVDYEGSSPQSSYGINCVPNYRFAHTAYALKCLLDPETPNNEGSLRALSDTAPRGSVLNPAEYAPVNARNLVGHAVPSVIFKALADVVGQRVQGDSGGGPMWSINCVGHDPSGRAFAALQFFHGGQGGRAGSDGLDTLSFPSNCRVTPVEMFEQLCPVVIEAKQLAEGSGGAGEYRGGLGQKAVIRNATEKPMTIFLCSERVRNPPFGVCGGEPGQPGSVLIDGQPCPLKGKLILEPGARLELRTPGGGGWGDPAARSPHLVEQDQELGLVSPAAGSNQEVDTDVALPAA